MDAANDLASGQNSDVRADDVALAVDLDGTLTRTDTLYESVLQWIAQSPLSAIASLLSWLRDGKAALKKRLAERSVAPAESLPYNEEVLTLLRTAKAGGRMTCLVTASDQKQAEAVAEYLGLFDEVHGSDGVTNLSGDEKAAFLVDRFGEEGFDYVGDAAVDMRVWKRARHKFTVGASNALRRRVTALDPDAHHLSEPATGLGWLKPYIQALRPHQWLKNLLVFTPAIAAHNLSAFGPALIAFIAFSLVASSVYVTNDLLDLNADRAHPRKKQRPFAAGLVPVEHGVIMAALLLVLGGVAGLFTGSLPFLGVLAVYFATTLAYSLYLKRRLIIDVWTLAALYTLRIIAGGVATGLVLSPWFLAFSMFIFLSLAAVKRLAELVDVSKRQVSQVSGRAYEVRDIPLLMGIALAAGYCAVLVFALYISNPTISALYSRPEFLWLVCPLLLYWISHIVMVTHRGEMHDDPIVYAVRDRASIAVVGLSAFVMILGAVL